MVTNTGSAQHTKSECVVAVSLNPRRTQPCCSLRDNERYHESETDNGQGAVLLLKRVKPHAEKGGHIN